MTFSKNFYCTVIVQLWKVPKYTDFGSKVIHMIYYIQDHLRSYTISCQEYKLEVWCQNCNTLLNVQYCSNKVHSTTVPMWNPCWSINGHKSSTIANAMKAACATPYEGKSGALWEGNHLSEYGCPLAGTTGHAY